MFSWEESDNLNFPSVSVALPKEVPFTKTVTPGNGIPSGPTTTPEMDKGSADGMIFSVLFLMTYTPST